MAAFPVINGYLSGREYSEFALPVSSHQHRFAHVTDSMLLLFYNRLAFLLTGSHCFFSVAIIAHLHKFLSGSNKRKQIFP